MNQKIIIAVLGVVVIILIGAIVYSGIINKANQPATSTTDSSKNTNDLSNLNQAQTITYLVSERNKTDFCNGADMDSEGYRKTITMEVVSDIPKAGLTEAELVKETAVLATDGMCQEVLKQLNFKVANGIVEIPPIEGWAGVSIAMCSCKPQVEVNLLRLPGVKQVIWSSGLAE